MHLYLFSSPPSDHLTGQVNRHVHSTKESDKLERSSLFVSRHGHIQLGITISQLVKDAAQRIKDAADAGSNRILEAANQRGKRGDDLMFKKSLVTALNAVKRVCLLVKAWGRVQVGLRR
jgi:hypothetical protein